MEIMKILEESGNDLFIEDLDFFETELATGEGYDDATYSLVVTIDTVQFDHASSIWNI